MEGRTILRILIAVAVFGGVFYFRMQRRADDSKQIHSEILQVLANMDGYSENEKVIKQMADVAHSQAFGAAYAVGSRRSGAKFDDEAYVNRFFDSMIEQAPLRMREKLVKPLREMKVTFLAALKSDKPAEG